MKKTEPLLNNASYLPMVSGSSTNLDEFKRCAWLHKLSVKVQLGGRRESQLTVNYRKFSMKKKDLWKIHVQFTVIYVAPHSGNKETIISSNSR